MQLRMAIERFHFSQAPELRAFFPSTSQLEELLLPTDMQPEMLVPGDHDLTPPEQYNPPFVHAITVFDQGTGLYRTTPIRAGNASLPKHARIEHGVRLPEDVPLAGIMTRIHETGGVRIHNIVRYVPNA